MSRLGLSVSYDEVTRYKQSVLVYESNSNCLPLVDGFIQWAAGNTDHNLATLDGSGSFHGMGVISMLTPKTANTVDVRQGTFCDDHVQRLKRMKVGDLSRNKTIPILTCKSTEPSKLATFILQPTTHLQFPYTLPVALNCDLTWHVGYFFKDVQQSRPNWSGYMQSVYNWQSLTTCKHNHAAYH